MRHDSAPWKTRGRAPTSLWRTPWTIVPDDLPQLLRRVADDIEERGIAPTDILDLTISNEVAGDRPWWSVTVYWSDK